MAYAPSVAIVSVIGYHVSMWKLQSRILVWLSGGRTSAVAAKKAVEFYRRTVDIFLVNTDTGSEDEDNYRFMDDVARWVDRPLIILKNEKYQDTFDVYDRSGYFMKPGAGAKCTTELKRRPRLRFQDLRTDLQVFGYSAEETARAAAFKRNNPEVRVWFPLIEHGITKRGAAEILAEAGIREPRTYAEGFRNANCLNTGCIKGGMGYWNLIRQKRPQVFQRMAEKERELGFALLGVEREVNGVKRRVPVYLDELDPQAGNYKVEPDIKCGLFCGTDTAADDETSTSDESYPT